MTDVESSHAAANGSQSQPAESKEPSTAQEFVQKIQDMTIEFNKQMENIGNVKSKFTALQSRSLSDSLKLNRATGKQQKEIEMTLNNNLLTMSDMKDDIISKMDALVAHTISLLRTKDTFINLVNQARVNAEEEVKKLKEGGALPTVEEEKPEESNGSDANGSAHSDGKRSALLKKLLKEAKEKGIDVSDLDD